MNYAIEQRLRFIDFLMLEYGYMTRSALMNYFAISQAQATKDIKDYMELAPNNMEYSTIDKKYKRTNQFKLYFGTTYTE